jgi:hypothetical protein
MVNIVMLQMVVNIVSTASVTCLGSIGGNAPTTADS